MKRQKVATVTTCYKSFATKFTYAKGLFRVITLLFRLNCELRAKYGPDNKSSHVSWSAPLSRDLSPCRVSLDLLFD